MGIAMNNAITGVLNFQKALDVVGNNLSNMQTPGYKKSSMAFKELMYMQLKGSSGPVSGGGGTNAIQVGLGAQMGGTTMNHTQGLLETTGRPTDMAITGAGFFAVKNNDGIGYTRNGTFNIDVAGNLVDSNGSYVQGWMADDVGNINTAGALESMVIPIGESAIVNATSEVEYQGNLDATAANDDSYTTEKVIFDSLGNEHTLAVTLTKVDPPTVAGADNQWNWSGTIDGVAAGGPFEACYNADGSFNAALSSDTPTLNYAPGGGADAMSVELDLSATTQFATPGQYSFIAHRHDGFEVGVLDSFSVDKSGFIIGSFSNGRHQTIGQLATASFTNPEGLIMNEGGIMRETANSGAPQIGTPLSGSRGAVTGGALEMSNVDISTEFTKMIISQRAFQSNSRLVKVMDEVMEEMANLKR
ncbi:MAG: flagellar hook protein FlgE [Vulcanimicrobiota bacterium]